VRRRKSGNKEGEDKERRRSVKRESGVKEEEDKWRRRKVKRGERWG